MKVQMGECKLDYPSDQLGELRDSSYLLGDMDALRQSTSRILDPDDLVRIVSFYFRTQGLYGKG